MKFSNVVGFIKNNPVVVGILGILFVVNLVVIQSAVMRQTNSDLKAAGGNYISTVTGTTSGSFDVTFCTDIINSGTWKATFWIETKGGTNLTANPVPVFYYPGPAACQTAKSVQANISGLTSLDLCNGLVARVFWQRDGQFYSQNYSFKSECDKLTPTVPVATNTPPAVATNTPSPTPTTAQQNRTIKITSPIEGQTINGSSLDLIVNASKFVDGDKILFLVGTVDKAWIREQIPTQSNIVTYSKTWTSVPSGNYTFYVQYFDKNGNITAVDDTVHFKVNNPALTATPEVKITILSPRDGMNVSTGTAPSGYLTVYASALRIQATDTVKFYILSTNSPTNCTITPQRSSDGGTYVGTCSINLPAGQYTLTALASDSTGKQLSKDTITLTLTSVGGPVATNTPSPTPTTGLTTCSGFVTKLYTSGSCGSAGKSRSVTVNNATRSSSSSVTLLTNDSCSTPSFTLNSNQDNPLDNYTVNISGNSQYNLHLTKDPTTNTCSLTVNLTNPTPIPTATPTTVDNAKINLSVMDSNRTPISSFRSGTNVLLGSQVTGTTSYIVRYFYKLGSQAEVEIFESGGVFPVPPANELTWNTSNLAAGTYTITAKLVRTGKPDRIDTKQVNVTSTSSVTPTAVNASVSLSIGNGNRVFEIPMGFRVTARVNGMTKEDYEKVVFTAAQSGNPLPNCTLLAPVAGSGNVYDFHCDINSTQNWAVGTHFIGVNVYQKGRSNPVAQNSIDVTLKQPCYDPIGNVTACPTAAAGNVAPSQVNPMAIAGAAALVIIFAGIYAFFSLR